MERYCRKIEDFPAEVGEQAISYVPPKDLCNLMLTSSKMRTLASNPKLWTEMKVVGAKVQQNGLSELFSIKRFSRIRKLDLNFGQITNEEFERNMVAIKLSALEELKLGFVDFGETPSDILALTSSHLQYLKLFDCQITSDQCNVLLEICCSNASLVQLELIHVRVIEVRMMDGVPAELLGRAIGSLQKVTIEDIYMTPDQCIAVLEACISSATPLRCTVTLEDLTYVSREGGELNYVPSNLLFRAASNLKKLALSGTGSYIDTDRCNAILEACSAAPNLVDLTLQWAGLEQVPVELFKRAASHLHSLDLEACDLSVEMLVALLETCIAVPTLVDISLAYMDLTEVPGELFVRARDHLNKMILDHSVLTDEQKMLLNTLD